MQTTVNEGEGLSDTKAIDLYEPFQMDMVLGQPVAEYVDWCITGLQQEQDQVSRELRAEAARAAMRLDDEIVGQLQVR